MKTIDLDTLTISATPLPPLKYQAAETHVFDLIHTKLNVSFNWEKQYLNGKAHLTLKPYFYSQNKLEIDAKGFDIHVVAIQKDSIVQELEYTYDNKIIFIELDKNYTRKDTFLLYIEYTAKPNELELGGSAAITSDKGLYFINPLNETAGKPQQIWTQGETESSSCWFPTIDIPNEKMTQEIYITVKEKFTTLSNGLLEFSMENGDGTRTDYWKQTQPHAPYLAMMAVGEFIETKDFWRDTIPVNYYLEQAYAPFAKAIFGNTPEMLTCFSDKLGVDYPWSKYHQVIVRDYVSGAMENTTAVIHGAYVQQTTREMLDGNNEDVVSHELFHHWFGDFLTCESWSNLPLNESFATYGEYIWREWKYGKENADGHLEDMLTQYLMESSYKQVDMIRFKYEDKEDMFDGHSYAKGGRILHVLRNVVGDAAFFASLKYYLEKNAYQTVEIHDLRLAFEKVTGQDLNWFFTQWFLSSGHPELQIGYQYNDSLKQQTVLIEQLQDTSKTPLFQLPIAIDLYVGGQIIRKEVVVNEMLQQFTFDVSEKPQLVNVDAKKMLLCQKTDNKTAKELIFQYKNAPLYLDRYEAINGLIPFAENDSLATLTLFEAINDKHHDIRKIIVKNCAVLLDYDKEKTKQLLIKVAQNDEKTDLKGFALEELSSEFDEDEDLIPIYEKATNDSSYLVVSTGLVVLAQADSEKGLARCKSLEKETYSDIVEAICYVYSGYGSDADNAYFVKAAKLIKSYTRISFVTDYEYFLTSEKRSVEVVMQGLDFFIEYAKSTDTKYVQRHVKKALKGIVRYYEGKKDVAEKKLNVILTDTPIYEETKQKIADFQLIIDKSNTKLEVYGQLFEK